MLLEAFRREIEENRLLADAYPAAIGQGRPWSQDRLRLGNGVVVEALGTGAKIRGRRNQAERPSLIIVDDPENDQHVVSPLQRGRSWSWFNRAVSNAGTPDTNVLVLGTALHRDCLVLRLTRTPGWQAKTFRAIETWPERLDLWHEWETRFTSVDDPESEHDARAFYETNREAMEEGCVLLWPERENLYDLMVQRVTIGHAAFESEKQANPINPEACEWPADYFSGPGFWFDEWPAGLVIKTLALDPSKGKDAQAGDYSALVKLGMDRSMTMYCEADLKRRPTPQARGRRRGNGSGVSAGRICHRGQSVPRTARARVREDRTGRGGSAADPSPGKHGQQGGADTATGHVFVPEKAALQKPVAGDGVVGAAASGFSGGGSRRRSGCFGAGGAVDDPVVERPPSSAGSAGTTRLGQLHKSEESLIKALEVSLQTR